LNISSTHSEVLSRIERSQGLRLSIAIHSCSRDASIALVLGGKTIRYLPLDPQNRTAATISPALNVLLDEVRASDQPLDYIAVTDGPGSFTGLRIGVTTAKTLGYALGISIVAVDSLAVMARNLWEKKPDASSVMVAINAYRGQVFAAHWTRQQWESANDSGDFSSQSRVVLADDWISAVAADRSCSNGAEPLLAGRIEQGRGFAIEPNALDVAQLGHQIASKGRFVSPMQLLPRYLRESAAEEKLGSVQIENWG